MQPCKKTQARDARGDYKDFWEGVPGGEGVRESASKMPAPSRAYVIAY